MKIPENHVDVIAPNPSVNEAFLLFEADNGEYFREYQKRILSVQLELKCCDSVTFVCPIEDFIRRNSLLVKCFYDCLANELRRFFSYLFLQ